MYISTSLLILILTKTGTNTFKEAAASTVVFFAPFHLGSLVFGGKMFSRISSHLLTIVGALSAALALALHHYSLYDDRAQC